MRPGSAPFPVFRIRSSLSERFGPLFKHVEAVSAVRPRLFQPRQQFAQPIVLPEVRLCATVKLVHYRAAPHFAIVHSQGCSGRPDETIPNRGRPSISCSL
jgi:hypothetical protein